MYALMSKPGHREVASVTMFLLGCLPACVQIDDDVKGGKEKRPDQRTGQENENLTRTSLLPRPNPLITFPSNLSGKGVSGPLSGPAVGSRGPSGRIDFVVLGVVVWWSWYCRRGWTERVSLFFFVCVLV